MEEINWSKEEMLIIDACQSYTYQGKKNKSPVLVWIITCVILVCAVGAVVYISANGGDFHAMMGIGVVAFFIIVAYIIKKLQFDAMKILTQYFRDENGDYFKVQFTKVSTKVIRIQQEYSLIPLVGEVKTLINGYKALKEKEGWLEEAYESAKSKMYESNVKGETKKVKIPEVYGIKIV